MHKLSKFNKILNKYCMFIVLICATALVVIATIGLFVGMTATHVMLALILADVAFIWLNQVTHND